MKIVARSENDYDGHGYLIARDDARLDANPVVQRVSCDGLSVSCPMSIGSLTAHDPYTDWQPATDPPPLAEVLADVVDWPDDFDYTPLGRPFLTKEVGERIIADATSV